MRSLPRPLDPVRSIKIKIGLILIGAGAAGMTWFSLWLGWFPLWTSVTAIIVALTTLQFLAHGMTSPLREMTAAARRMAQGDYNWRVRATSRDEVGQLAEAFNQMAADLAAADRQRRELIANVSHELRTPITALHGLLENIVDGVAEAEPAMMQTALAQTERLGRLVAELLDLSRVDAGVVALARAPINVPDFLDDVVAEARVNAAGAGRDVHFEIVAPHVVVPGDRGRLHQVFANLLDNAARHSPPGGTVLVRAERRDDHLLVAVADEGAGIPPGERDRVFERFTRGERPTGGGTGLGLAIARWVVQLHRGTIAVVEPDQDRSGCHIHVTLPLQAPA
ncbi:HAMP domain-containing sensor histidine kinase [Paractinoplanes toevensis]|uniref:Signal transduction histidine-protein kinase/phosphatase MprB n=1 Tax=Paractinoplanes toevensis TaxID=571911 RepID=A0A919TF71_9ACTN|nr:HAMP domain-containing sensor histidine kinase [Actinoplanes toevensis]GIM94440.1 two-component sensor histidine kinase [Actinoplanes toevensis]